MSVRSALRALTIGTLMAAVGCDAKPPPLAVVRGIVTFRGVPVRCALVVFTPDGESGGRGSCACGETGSDGRFTLITDGKPGAAPGRHRITVASLETYSSSRLPDKLRDPAASGLRAEVVAGRENAIDFHLQPP